MHEVDENSPPKPKRKKYEKELRALQAKLCALQDWVKATGQRIIVVFEGREATGKGGTIKAITERVSAPVFRLIALGKALGREKVQFSLELAVAKYVEFSGRVGGIDGHSSNVV
jgi:polyphosphate kinase 2 (PPK2 family)